MGTHPIFESDFDCLTEIDIWSVYILYFLLMLHCAQFLSSECKASDVSSYWDDLSICSDGIVQIQKKFFVFFKNEKDAKKAVDRGLKTGNDHRIKHVKLLSMPDAVSSLRTLVQKEKKLNAEFEYPTVFEKNNIKINWGLKSTENGQKFENFKVEISNESEDGVTD